jgi:hypothetical protein
LTPAPVLTVHCKRQSCRAVLAVVAGPDKLRIGLASVPVVRSIGLECPFCKEVTYWHPRFAARSQEQADVRAGVVPRPGGD